MEMLTWKSHHVYTGLKNQVFHRSICGTAANLRAGHMGVFITGGMEVVSSIVKKCFTCLKRSSHTLYHNMLSYHRIAVEQPFERVSLDVVGPYCVKASNTGRALVKLHSLMAVCLSTGLVTQVLMDRADFPTMVRAVWMIQLRYNVQITHIHTDAGSVFLKLGDTAKVGNQTTQKGEYLRLFLMLQSIKKSSSKGQASNVIESSIKRLKSLWKTSKAFLEGTQGYSMMELDFLLEMLCGTLNNQPLDPQISGICPGDYLSGYRAIPQDFEYHDSNNVQKKFDKIRRGYQEMAKAQEKNRLLTPYVWKTRGSGRIKRNVKVNDVVYIKPIQRLGIVKDISATQVYVRFINKNKQKQHEWYKKDHTVFLLAGSQFDNKETPSHQPTHRIYPSKGEGNLSDN